MSRTLRHLACGGYWALAGASGDIPRDMRGMERCLGWRRRMVAVCVYSPIRERIGREEVTQRLPEAVLIVEFEPDGPR
jgi:hypothetical protein